MFVDTSFCKKTNFVAHRKVEGSEEYLPAEQISVFVLVDHGGFKGKE